RQRPRRPIQRLVAWRSEIDGGGGDEEGEGGEHDAILFDPAARRWKRRASVPILRKRGGAWPRPSDRRCWTASSTTPSIPSSWLGGGGRGICAARSTRRRRRRWRGAAA